MDYKTEQIKKKLSELEPFVLDSNNASIKNEFYELKTLISSKLDNVKYGLVFEESKEDIEAKCETMVPYLEREREREINADALNGRNYIIEGDNYASLKLLEKTHKGKIDIIYIDPPYNTGNEDFAYNDKFVNLDDGFLHSKWLSFIKKRLNLAKKLLKDDGLIFISIDDNEQANLKLLLDSIFGPQNFVSTFIIDKTAQGANQSVTFKTQHEYCILYKNNSSDKINYEVDSECDDKKFKYKDEKGIYAITNSFDSINSPLSSNRNRGYTIYYRESDGDAQIRDEFDRDSLTFKEYNQGLINDGYIPIRPGIRKNVQYPWNWEPSRFLRDYRQELVFCKNKKGVLSVYHKNRFSGKTKDTTIKKFDTRQQGNQLLVDILNVKKFDYPKSLDMMKWVISKHKNKNALILDFFAGSGTTGHATLELNKEDGGNRHFILCTNNENNICEEVTYERLKTVITGKRKDGTIFRENPYNDNLTYLKVNFTGKTENLDPFKICEQLISLKNSLESQPTFIFNNDDEFYNFLKSNAQLDDCIVYLLDDVLLPSGIQLRNHNISEVRELPAYFYNEEELIENETI